MGPPMSSATCRDRCSSLTPPVSRRVLHVLRRATLLPAALLAGSAGVALQGCSRDGSGTTDARKVGQITAESLLYSLGHEGASADYARRVASLVAAFESRYARVHAPRSCTFYDVPGFMCVWVDTASSPDTEGGASADGDTTRLRTQLFLPPYPIRLENVEQSEWDMRNGYNQEPYLPPSQEEDSPLLRWVPISSVRGGRDSLAAWTERVARAHPFECDVDDSGYCKMLVRSVSDTAAFDPIRTLAYVEWISSPWTYFYTHEVLAEGYQRATEQARSRPPVARDTGLAVCAVRIYHGTEVGPPSLCRPVAVMQGPDTLLLAITGFSPAAKRSMAGELAEFSMTLSRRPRVDPDSVLESIQRTLSAPPFSLTLRRRDNVLIGKSDLRVSPFIAPYREKLEIFVQIGSLSDADPPTIGLWVEPTAWVHRRLPSGTEPLHSPDDTQEDRYNAQIGNAVRRAVTQICRSPRWTDDYRLDCDFPEGTRWRSSRRSMPSMRVRP